MLSKADIARLRSLRDKKHRDALGLFAVEGEKVVVELLATGQPLCELYVTTAWQIPAKSGQPNPKIISAAEMARISHFPTPSSVLAVGRIDRPTLVPATTNHGFTLLLDGIQDAGNLGTLLRIADWFAIDCVVASPDTVDVYNQKVIHASMGSFSRVKFFSTDLPTLLAETTVPIFGCDLAGDDVHNIAPVRDAMIAIGSEGRGLSPAVRAKVSRFITIPRFGSAESLNAAVAAAVVCDNLRRIGAPSAL